MWTVPVVTPYEILLPENTKERTRTNVSAFYFCIAMVIAVLGGFVTYALFNGSIYRITKGIDDCGNICGMKNDENTIAFCGANDKEAFPFTLVNYITTNSFQPNNIYTHSKCVKSCRDYPGYVEVVNHCFLANGIDSTQADFGSILHQISQDLVLSWSSILLSCAVAFVFSYILLILFRYATQYIIWIIYIGVIVVLTIGAIVMLVYHFIDKKENDAESSQAFLFASIGCALFAVILALVILCLRKRIRLVIQLFKEASKALGDVPLIVTEPLLTFGALVLSTIAFSYFVIVIESSGRLQQENDANGQFLKATYVKDIGMVIAHYVNLVAYLWFTQFIIGCQHFVIAGTVCQWFFARTKAKLDSPIKRSFNHLLRFHIGSICLGAIVLTIVKIVRMIVNGIKNSLRNSDNVFANIVGCCCDFIVQQLEELFQYFVRNAYIIVALEGTPFMDSGKRAFKLLAENLIDVIALNNVGDFVLFLGRIFVTLIAGLVSYEFVSRNDAITMKFVPVILSVIFAFLIVHCFMTVYEMTLDTIFICFCVDCEQNDGTSRPYFMSRKMMEVMIELKGAAGGEFTNFGVFKHSNASETLLHNQNVEGGPIRPMLPPNLQFSQ